jgi:DNA polymerase III alpha subunit (gram-positive type)
MNPKLCFLDVETTGMSSMKHGIIQIAGIICKDEGGRLEEIEEFSFNVSPFPADLIEDEALAISGLTREQIKGFAAPADVHKNLTAIFEKHCNKYDKKDKMIFVGYNVSFDYGFLRRWFEKAGDKYFGSWFWHPAVDVMSLAMLRMAGVRHELTDFKLTTVAAKLGILLPAAHTAPADIRATRHVFERVTR